ncbi:MAG: DNA repair protein RadA [Candidatus Lindowbacteria bacterium RIFCSPLOWO2_12_FULL_62_27]|nr:MAG: DNA repair protein RadA [Candidatus Lindowbacteria bacterium RIFCSPLOWO2_02_FULL_62_12]OGH59615.1 MAG: DNA repair protein RadA [Candidatus Lindowbacteria bacterium RIFCSPLOWO2_12_FULL_62_27]
MWGRLSSRMTKVRTRFFCDACGYETVKWMGRCPGCEAYDSMVEAVQEPAASEDAAGHQAAAPLKSLGEIASTERERIPTGWGEVDRVLGGGIVPGSLTLLGGEPGIGKSTLLLSAGLRLASAGRRCVYIAAEESAPQVRMRADRISENNPPPEFFVCETSDLPAALKATAGAAVVVLDSIQTVRVPTLRSISGSVLQIRESVFRIQEAAKPGDGANGPAFLLVGHITKGGEIAGPKILEHMVDCVLAFEGDRRMGLRFLRAQKNRFGSTDEIGVFEMGGKGLEEITDPGALFRSAGPDAHPGVAVSSLVEGSRAFLVEIQALTQEVSLAMPRRVATGVDPRRLLSILAVLDKRAGVRLGTSDVFLTAVGGFLAREPAADLAVAMAIASAARNRPLPATTAFVGEVTLTGELRLPPSLDRRVGEAARLGFGEIVLPDSARGRAGRLAAGGVDIIYSRSIVQCVEKYVR